jgi:tRNA/tmRNA/rRNA uracil-C5-methylase (TrmA/RlmC/RlmD family)
MVVALTLLAGCGLSAQQRRVCEMYLDAGGKPALTETQLAKYIMSPDQVAERTRARQEVSERARENMRHGLSPDGSKALEVQFTEEDIARVIELSDKEMDEKYTVEYRVRETLGKNAVARGVVALRLSLTQSEVNDALTKCQSVGWKVK